MVAPSLNSRYASQRWPHSWPEHAERVVLAEKRLRRILADTSRVVHVDDAAQAAAAAEIAARVEDVDADAPDLVRHRELERERAGLGRSRVREDDELVEVVAVRLIELLRHRDEVEIGLRRKALADGAAAAADGGPRRVADVRPR